MADKPAAKRRREARTVQLEVGGSPVELNGFVQDVLQETVTALVRALGNLDDAGTIAIRIGPENDAR